MKRLPRVLLLAAALAAPLPTHATTMAEMMYVMGRMMAGMMGQMMGQMVGSAINSANGGGSFNPAMNFGTGMSPWSALGMGGWPGAGAWPSAWNWPATNGVPWGQGPYGYGGYPGATSPWNYSGSGAAYRALQGRWIGASGDLLAMDADRFVLRAGQYAIAGRYRVQNDHLLLYSPQDGRVIEYRLAFQGPGLALRDSYGQTLLFQRVGYPVWGSGGY